ncbi:hypothetical protein [uncultured Sutterella sp.]|uniref:hypothetical protein n=1 Tax=uncultured Sutterella sp. TaxID=286133 RepID=UPI0025F3AA5C|nr:hypothetical protein [uncultured Sutterella sp.]
MATASHTPATPRKRRKTNDPIDPHDPIAEEITRKVMQGGPSFSMRRASSVR